MVEMSFAGYDSLFATRKWHSDGPSTPRSSEQVYVSTEYRIFWPVLIGEWVLILLAAGSLFFVLSRRLIRGKDLSN
jgi:hypothetical protein